MRYGYEFKRRAVELYRQGKWIDPPPNCDTSNIKNFHDQIVRWYKLEENNGPEVLNNKRPKKKLLPEEKLELVMQAIHEPPVNVVAQNTGIKRMLDNANHLSYCLYAVILSSDTLVVKYHKSLFLIDLVLLLTYS